MDSKRGLFKNSQSITKRKAENLHYVGWKRERERERLASFRIRHESSNLVHFSRDRSFKWADNDGISRRFRLYTLARINTREKTDFHPHARTHTLSSSPSAWIYANGPPVISLSLRRAAESGVDNTLARSLRPPPLRNSASITRVFCDTLYKPSPLLPWKASLNEPRGPPRLFCACFV